MKLLIGGSMTLNMWAQTAESLLLAYSRLRESRLPGRSRVRQNSQASCDLMSAMLLPLQTNSRLCMSGVEATCKQHFVPFSKLCAAASRASHCCELSCGV
jgi:hypothetical protein